MVQHAIAATVVSAIQSKVLVLALQATLAMTVASSTVLDLRSAADLPAALAMANLGFALATMPILNSTKDWLAT
jgi:hypothetical protein